MNSKKNCKESPRSGIIGWSSFRGKAAKAAGLQVGDEILQINGTEIDSAEDVHRALNQVRGKVELKVLRKNKEHTISFSPQMTEKGPKLGVLLRQGVTGIGTVTYYDPETGKFGSLGHGVSSSDGSLVDMTGGNAYGANVISVIWEVISMFLGKLLYFLLMIVLASTLYKTEAAEGLFLHLFCRLTQK